VDLMTDTRLTATMPTRSAAWTRDHVLGCLLLGVNQIEAEGQVRIAAELRHLAMLWYTGARRASPTRVRGVDTEGPVPLRARRRARPDDPMDG
jgi:hypothetical protein